MSQPNRILALSETAAAPAPLITVGRLACFAPLCDAAALAPALQAAAERFEIATLQRASAWLGQIHVESAGLTRLVENLTYSADRLCQVWPARFPSLQAAAICVGDPRAIAEKVYGGRLGNSSAGDGYRYRGRGLLQLTGRDNYVRFGQALGLDLAGVPDLAADPAIAATIAGAFWSQHGLNAPADRGDVEAITRAINGGLTGYADRVEQVARARAALQA